MPTLAVTVATPAATAIGLPTDLHDPGGDLLGVVGRREVLAEHDELVAPRARDDVAGPDHRLEPTHVSASPIPSLVVRSC